MSKAQKEREAAKEAGMTVSEYRQHQQHIHSQRMATDPEYQMQWILGTTSSYEEKKAEEETYRRMDW